MSSYSKKRRDVRKIYKKEADDEEDESKDKSSAPSASINRTKDKGTNNECEVPKNKDFCQINDIVEGRYFIVGKVREGGYGQIYKALDKGSLNEVALKLETTEPNAPNVEAIVMSKFSAKSDHCPKLYGYGTLSPRISYVAMQLLGKSLSDLRKQCKYPLPRFSMSSLIRLTTQCFESIEEIHISGIVHRDIKPSNFAIGCTSKTDHRVYLFDFGLSRIYVDRKGAVRPERDNAGFRGTLRYASLNAHENKDLARRDDMISMFYSFFEMLHGRLPWNSEIKEQVYEAKKKYSLERMCNYLPSQCIEIAKSLQRLKYADTPPYKNINVSIKNIGTKFNVKDSDLYDWETADCRKFYHWPPSA